MLEGLGKGEQTSGGGREEEMDRGKEEKGREGANRNIKRSRDKA